MQLKKTNRNVFLSFLGTTNYTPCHYIHENYKSDKIRFVQQATMEYLGVKDWSKEDKSIILVTEGQGGSFKKNWLDNGQINYQTGESLNQPGLKSVLSKMNLPVDSEVITIKNGNNESEIWEIFKTIFEILKPMDVLYIDITHGFRYLPMLAVVLANYGKLLKNITIESISYGNYEGRNQVTNEAPIIELLSFSQLQDWTNAANLFVNHGSLEELVEITNKNIIPLARKAKGKDQNLNALRRLSNELNSFSIQLKTNRLPAIIDGQTVKKINEELSIIQDQLITPLMPILEMIKTKVDEFYPTHNTLNGLKATQFCLDNGLIQQAITIFQETLICLVLESENLPLTDGQLRNYVSSEFKNKKDPGIIKNENVNIDEKIKKSIQNNLYIEELKNIVDSLRDKRNDINHANYSHNPLSDKSAFNLKLDIDRLLKRTYEKLENLR